MDQATGEDTRLIDPRAPRLNQFVSASLVVVAFAFNVPLLLPATAAMLYIGVLLGPAWVPAYRFYFAFLQPRLSQGELEDYRLPNFAKGLGSAWIFTSWLLIDAGWVRLGWGLVLTLAASALYASLSGFCLGCFTYRLTAKLSGVRAINPVKVDPADFAAIPGSGPGPRLLSFSHPLCSECQEWDRRLTEHKARVIKVNVQQNPQLARKYGIDMVPTIWELADDGTVLRQVAP